MHKAVKQAIRFWIKPFNSIFCKFKQGKLLIEIGIPEPELCTAFQKLPLGRIIIAQRHITFIRSIFIKLEPGSIHIPAIYASTSIIKSICFTAVPLNNIRFQLQGIISEKIRHVLRDGIILHRILFAVNKNYAWNKHQ